MTQDCRCPVITYLIATAFLAAAFFVVPLAATAQSVTVTTGVDGISLDGRVVGYDGTYLELETSYGLMTLRYADVVCEGDTCPDKGGHVPVVRLSGAARMGEVLLPALIEAFGRSMGLQAAIDVVDPEHLTVTLRDAREVDHAIFTLRLTSTDEGFADLITFEADVVMALREVREREAERARMIGLGDITDPRQARIIGFDALVPIVNPVLGIRTIALRDLARAFRREVTNWSELGGPDLPMTLHLGPASGGPWQYFRDHVVTFDGQTLSEDIVRHATVAELAASVVETPGSLGVVPYRETANAQPLPLRDGCGFTALPQSVTLKTQDYPLTEPLFLYVADRLQPQIIHDFFVWLRGTEAQLVVRRAGFVDQGAVPISLDAQGQRFANAIAQAGDDVTLEDLQRMVVLLTPLTRLSTSFRFVPETKRLDAVARSNLLALGQAIRDGRYDGQRLVLVGFGDSSDQSDLVGDPALERAAQVRAALVAALGVLPDDVVVDIDGFGSALPMGCDDTVWGRQRNHRVELWVDQR